MSHKSGFTLFSLLPSGQSSAKLPVIWSSGQSVIQSSSHLFILSSGYPIIWSSSHLVNLSSCHLVIRTSGHLVIWSSGHLVILTHNVRTYWSASQTNTTLGLTGLLMFNLLCEVTFIPSILASRPHTWVIASTRQQYTNT